MGTAPVPASSAPIAHGVMHRGHRIHVPEHPGAVPPLVLPHLAGRRVLTADFLGWGASDKPGGHPRTAHDQTAEVAAVVVAQHVLAAGS